MNSVNKIEATSAIPIGIPGWPDFAFSTASIDKNLIAFGILLSILENTLYDKYFFSKILILFEKKID